MDTRVEYSTPDMIHQIIGEKGQEGYDEQVFYISEYHTLWCYSFLEKNAKKVFKFDNRVFTFKLFMGGEIILVGGESHEDKVKAL